jgi:hypothetical protein
VAGHRRYTRKDKASAVTTAVASNVLAAAQESGIPRSTIRYWVESPEFAELRQKTREEAAEGWQVVQHLALARLKELIPTMEARDLTVLAGIAVDKSQLLGGQATSRHETVTEGWDDHERTALRESIREHLDKRGVES